MHAFFPPFGVMPNNAIVGGSADIAVGSALFKRVNRRPGIVIANIGDASMGCGPVWEAMMFAAMDQYRTLWPEDAGGAPPILFNFMNNFYGMGGQPQGETMGFGMLVARGPGRQPGGDARRARRRLQSAGRRRRHRTQAQDPRRRPRAGAARHRHLPLLRPLALRRHGLPHQGRDGGLAQTGPAGRLPRLSGGERPRRRDAARRDAGRHPGAAGAGPARRRLAGALAARRPEQRRSSTA